MSNTLTRPCACVRSINYPSLPHPLTPNPVHQPSRLKHRKPPELPKGFLAWVRPLMSIPQERILQLAGLDAYMLLRFIRLCLKVSLV